jgi:hypothetical protein
VLKWPDRAAVDAAVRALAQRLAAAQPHLLRFGYFGSYARGDWSVGSDVDLVAIVSHASRPFAERAPDFDLSGLPVPAELIVYTEDEWGRLLAEPRRFVRDIAAQAVWVFERSGNRRLNA